MLMKKQKHDKQSVYLVHDDRNGVTVVVSRFIFLMVVKWFGG